MLWPKSNSFKDFDKEKKFLRLENSPPPPSPPDNFSNGPFLRLTHEPCLGITIVSLYFFGSPRRKFSNYS